MLAGTRAGVLAVEDDPIVRPDLRPILEDRCPDARNGVEPFSEAGLIDTLRDVLARRRLEAGEQLDREPRHVRRLRAKSYYG